MFKETTRCDAWQQKRGRQHSKTTRPHSIQLVPGTEASAIELADVVSPTEGIGEPQLTRALGYVLYEGSRISRMYVLAALLTLMYTVLNGPL